LQRVFGNIADRVDPRNLVIWGTILSGLVIPAMTYVDGFYMILLLNIIMGIGNGIAMPGGYVITGQVGKTMGMGSMMGITDSGWSLGMIVAPIISGIIMDRFGIPSIFLTGGILTIIGVLLVAFFLRGYTPSAQESSTVSDVVPHRH
jgi:MFS family permease